MNAKANKELIQSTAVAIGAWLIVLAAGAGEQVETSGAVVYINYQLE